MTALFGASVPIAGKIAYEAFGPFTMTFLRFLSATIFLFPFILKTKELNYRNFKKYFWVSVIGAANPILFFIGLQFTKASVTQLFYASVPALSAAYLFYVEGLEINRKQVMGILLGLLGVLFIIVQPLLQAKVDLNMVLGNMIIFVAALSFMIYGIVSKKKQQINSISPIALTFYFSLVTFMISLPLLGFELATIGFVGTVGIKHVLSGIFAGVIGTGGLYLLYQYALKIGNAVTASLFSYLNPVFAILMAMFILGETVSLPIIAGGVLAVVGAQLASSKK